LLLQPPAVSAVPGRITDDAFTVETSSSNFGISGVLHVVDAANAQKTFIKFDLSSLTSALPPVTGADVDKATLTIFLDGVGSGGSIAVDEVTSAWDEGTISGTSEPTVGATDTTFSVTTAEARKFVTIDITAQVQAWLDAPASNNGIALIPVATSGVQVALDSKE